MVRLLRSYERGSPSGALAPGLPRISTRLRDTPRRAFRVVMVRTPREHTSRYIAKAAP